MEEQNSQQGKSTSSQDNGSTVAIISYLSLLGWVIAIIVHGNGKTSFGAYHLRQSIGLLLTGVALWIVVLIMSIFAFIPFLGAIITGLAWLVGIGAGIALLILWVIGLLGAINGEEKPVPYLGEFYQRTFSSLK